MSTLPAAHNRAGNVRGFRIAGSAFTIGALSLLVSNSAFAAETAGAILKKMAENYTKAKSFQASIVTIQAGKTPDGKAFTVTQNEQVQYKTPNLFHKSVKATGIGPAVTGQMAEQLASRQGEIYSDGKIATMYVPAKKMYQKQPVPPNVVIAQLVDLLRKIPPANQPGLSLLPAAATVQGRQAFVIEFKPAPPAGAKPEDVKKYNEALKQVKQFHRFMIDKQNYNLLEYTLVTTSGTAKVNLSSQVFGGSIPSSAFAFSPPAGAKEFKAPPPGQGMPGMAPGGGPVHPGIGIKPGGTSK